MPTPTEKTIQCAREAIALYKSIELFTSALDELILKNPKIASEDKSLLANLVTKVASLRPEKSFWYEMDLTQGNRGKANARNARWRAKQMLDKQQVSPWAEEDAKIFCLSLGGSEAVFASHAEEILSSINSHIESTGKDVDGKFILNLLSKFQ
jgi:hypothetical protein